MPDSVAPQVRSQRAPDLPPEGDRSRAGRLSLRARVLLGYLLLLVAFGLVLTAVLLEMRSTQVSLAMLSAGYLPLARDIGGAEATPLGLELEPGQDPTVVYERRGTERHFIALKSSQLTGARDIAASMRLADLAPGDENVTESIAEEIQEAIDTLNRYSETHDAFVAAYEANDPAIDSFVMQLLTVRTEVVVRLRNLRKRVQRRITSVVAEADRSQRDARFAIAALSSVAFGIGLLLVLATGLMLRPIRSLIAGAERIGEGRFGERVAIRSGDEVGRLARAFNAMAASLDERESKLEERTEQLEAALSELRDSQTALIRSERLATIGQMAAQIAHEVRNPLNALGLNADLLGDEVRSGNAEEATETLSAIKQEIERLTAITESYLALGRLPPMRLDPYPVDTLVRELVRFQQEELGRAGVRVTVDLPPGLPEVQADGGQLRQALLNIVRNAGEALGDAGGGHLAITAMADGDDVRVELQDDGPGMEADLVSRIFDPFFSTKERGSGLGLPITHQVIAEHGGRITCTSSPGEGTRFTIWLPRAHEESTGEMTRNPDLRS